MGHIYSIASFYWHVSTFWNFTSCSKRMRLGPAVLYARILLPVFSELVRTIFPSILYGRQLMLSCRRGLTQEHSSKMPRTINIGSYSGTYGLLVLCQGRPLKKSNFHDRNCNKLSGPGACQLRIEIGGLRIVPPRPYSHSCLTAAQFPIWLMHRFLHSSFHIGSYIPKSVSLTFTCLKPSQKSAR